MQSQILQRIIVKGHSPADTESIFVHTFLAQVHKQFETIETAVVEIDVRGVSLDEFIAIEPV